VCGAVETYWDGVQIIRIRAALTVSWNQQDALPEHFDIGNATSPSSGRGG
jgi:hypothetical protein